MDNYKHHIFALIGRSGSGKTSLLRFAKRYLRTPKGVTTRKPREDDYDDYIFTDIDKIVQMAINDELVLLNQVYGSTFYAYKKEDFLIGDCIVVVDLVGLRQLQEVFGYDNVTGIYVECPVDIINSRKTSSSSRIAERELYDNNKFRGIFNLCDYKITNDSCIDESVDNLKSIIKEVLYDKSLLQHCHVSDRRK